jgi:predicted metalloprotease
MRWKSGRRSSNVEDRRNGGGGMRAGRIDGQRMPVRRRTVAGGGLGLVVVVVLAMVFGIDPSVLIGLTDQMNQGQPPSTQQAPGQYGSPLGGQPGQPGLTGGRQDELAQFVSVVLADTEDTWNAIFRQGGADYREPKLVLFTDYVRSACGLTESAVGPFYCPADEKVYIDLSFYDELQNKYRAPGDFAQAYVIAHEVGHHVQNLLGISSQVTQAQRAAGKRESNRLSVMLELQADCLAGVWAHHAHDQRNILEQGDIEEAMNAAAQIGDDRMQKRATGFVMPDSFTHGSSEQRARWFRTGLASGDVQSCNTFEAASL